MWTLAPIIALLLALLWVAGREFYLLAVKREPYTFYGRALIINFPAIAILIASVVNIGLGWLICHLFKSCL